MPVMMDIAMFGWLPFCLTLFAYLPPRRAVIAGFIISWLFLPITSYSTPGFPDYDKISASIWGVLLGVVFYDHGRLLTFRPHWGDLPMLVWCTCPMISSLSNNLGVWDGLSAVVAMSFLWGIPYFLGRIYFRTVGDLRDLAMGVFISGLIYIPFCLLEWRLSPQLHRIVYGEHQHEFQQSIRAIGYRPLVFMTNGLVLSMWMMIATLSGYWLWRHSHLKRLKELPASAGVAALACVTLLCQSVNAIALFTVGLGVLYTGRWWKTSLPLILLLITAPTYIYIRTVTNLSPQPAVELVAHTVSEERSRSLDTRFLNEDMLMEKAWERPVTGWGRWGRSRITNAAGQDISKTDGLWIIAFGQSGFLGLTALLFVFATPVALFLWRCPPYYWNYSSVGPALVMAVTVSLFSVDNLLNATSPPIIVLCMGGIVNLRNQAYVRAAAGVVSARNQTTTIRFV